LITLNLMVKALQAESIGLWKNVDAALFLEYDENQFTIGPTGDHATASWVKTEVATAAASGAGTITVDSDTGISDADVIGVELDDGTLQWTTVNGAPAADVITLTAVLTDDVAVDNHVYAYTTILQRPLEITDVSLVMASGYERKLNMKTRSEYMTLTNKDERGTVNIVYYDPQRTNAKLYIWQACNDVQEYIKFTARIPIEDFDSNTNDPDFPQEWLLALAWNLAVLIAPKFGKTVDQMFIARAQALLNSVSEFDREQGSIYLTTGRR
jgi:hypothetical protein